METGGGMSEQATKIQRPFMVDKITTERGALPCYSFLPTTLADHPGGGCPDDTESEEFSEWCAAVDAANKEFLSLGERFDVADFQGLSLHLDIDLSLGDKVMLTVERL